MALKLIMSLVSEKLNYSWQLILLNMSENKNADVGYNSEFFSLFQ